MFGVYLHVPFCTSRCDYCAFATWTDKAHLVDEYMAACKQHAAALADSLPQISSVFVGGGTPNLVPPAAVLSVLGEFNLSSGAEITVECNPDLVTTEQMNEFAAGGVNRISLGVQSMVPEVLQALGREHDPAAVHKSVESVRSAGISQLNLDLIFGGSGESMDDWLLTLSQAVELDPDHISSYGLTVEPGTPLADDLARHPDDDDQAEKYLAADDVLGSAGYENYEISNWAKLGSRCQHNLLYWAQGEYIGIGAAAHSHRDGCRWWNVRTPERYIEAVTGVAGGEIGEVAAGVAGGEIVSGGVIGGVSGGVIVAGSERLSEAERRVERLQLEIRTSEGIATQDTPNNLSPEVAELLEAGADGRTRLTRRGRLLANEVALHFE